MGILDEQLDAALSKPISPPIIRSTELKPAPAPDFLTGDQRLIWDMFEECKVLCVQKNLDYGSSVFKIPAFAPECAADTAIRVRMSDKFERITNLIRSGNQQVKSESIEDTLKDLGVYCFLAVIARRHKKT